ncbi:MAG: hypothetical protein IPQ08_05860 [Chitinophagaceae bacterium]|nr:hypothetical protein [Chitinophagaceae bacterium]
MELVFEAKEKKMTLNLYGTKYSIRVPKMKESIELQSKIKDADAKEVVQIYFDFFTGIGLPSEAMDALDSLDFQELISFILYPKKS